MLMHTQGYEVENTDRKCPCPICFSSKKASFLSIPNIPVMTNAVYTSHTEALQARRGDVHLVLCLVCGHIYNDAFDLQLADYNQEYDNTLFYSPTYFNYAETLAEEFIKRFNLVGKDIIMVGCGRGDFLELLCKKGNNRGVGFDPSLIVKKIENPMPDQISYIRDYYNHSYAHYPVDLIVCSHVLEHVFNVREFMNNILQGIGERQPIVYFEVPNVMFSFKKQAIWDVIYEHFSYFSRHSLADLFLRYGFKVSSIDERFAGQFLSIEGLAIGGQFKYQSGFFNNVENYYTSALHFGETFQKEIDQWKNKLESFKRTGQKIVIWGTGSKGINFLNLVDKNKVIEYAIDISPFKHGNFVAGTGQKIMGPDFLRSYRPDKIIVMNPIYLEEIRKITEKLNVQAEMVLSY